MNEALEVIFWGSVFLVFYTYLAYPVLLVVASGLVQSFRDTQYILTKTERRMRSRHEHPSVGVIVSAYNEEKHIQQRIENLLAQHYPPDKLKIYIGSDGSTDDTARIVRTFTDPRIVFFDFQENRGKISVLNDLVGSAEDPILVFTDANTEYTPNALLMLVRHFADRSVGAVCGDLNLVDPATGDNKDGLYWKWERVLKFHESKLHALLGANGAIYAIQRELYKPLPEDTIVDDFTIVMNIALAGYQVKYDPEAVAIEEVPPYLKDEYKRRVRIGTGNYQSFFRLLRVFHPKHKWLVFTFLSHKALRWFAPHLMIVALLSNLLLLPTPLYAALFASQCALYLLCFVGYKQKSIQNWAPPLQLMIFLFSINLSFLRGFQMFLSGQAKGSWSRTKR